MRSSTPLAAAYAKTSRQGTKAQAARPCPSASSLASLRGASGPRTTSQQHPSRTASCLPWKCPDRCRAPRRRHQNLSFPVQPFRLTRGHLRVRTYVLERNSCPGPTTSAPDVPSSWAPPPSRPPWPVACSSPCPAARVPPRRASPTTSTVTATVIWRPAPRVLSRAGRLRRVPWSSTTARRAVSAPGATRPHRRVPPVCRVPRRPPTASAPNSRTATSTTTATAISSWAHRWRTSAAMSTAVRSRSCGAARPACRAARRSAIRTCRATTGSASPSRSATSPVTGRPIWRSVPPARTCGSSRAASPSPAARPGSCASTRRSSPARTRTAPSIWPPATSTTTARTTWWWAPSPAPSSTGAPRPGSPCRPR